MCVCIQDGKKLERCRDLFEQVLDGCPAKFAKCEYLKEFLVNLLMCVCVIAYYLLYAKLEEQYGLARHAMAIYNRATRAVLPEEQFEVGVC